MERFRATFSCSFSPSVSRRWGFFGSGLVAPGFVPSPNGFFFLLSDIIMFLFLPPPSKPFSGWVASNQAGKDRPPLFFSLRHSKTLAWMFSLFFLPPFPPFVFWVFFTSSISPRHGATPNIVFFCPFPPPSFVLQGREHWLCSVQSLKIQKGLHRAPLPRERNRRSLAFFRLAPFSFMPGVVPFFAGLVQLQAANCGFPYKSFSFPPPVPQVGTNVSRWVLSPADGPLLQE